MRSKEKGFSLIDIVATILIISILAYSVAVDWNPTNINVDLDNTTEQLAQDIRFTQTIAISRNQQFRLNLLSATSYNITNSGGVPVSHPLAGTANINLPGNMSMASAGLPANYILFDALGIPYTAPGVPLAANATITISVGGANLTITIFPQTGRVMTS